jgi:hypothetical protein
MFLRIPRKISREIWKTINIHFELQNTLEQIRKNDRRIFKDPKFDKNCFTTAEASSLMERGI